MQDESSDTTTYRAVMNHEGQYSIWPVQTKLPNGWVDGGKQGSKAECLAFIAEAWPDIRPLSLQQQGTAASAAVPEPVHAPIEQVARATPDAPAVVHGDRTMSYASLMERVTELAWRIQETGIGCDQPVGLCIDRSFDLIAGMVAIAKAGCPYLPLDPTYPDGRLHDIIAESGVAVVLTERRHAARLTQVRTHVLVDDGVTATGAPAPRWAGPDGLVYVSYTSGTTGKPKGACSTHRTMSPFLRWCASQPGGFKARTLQNASISFGVSFSEIFGALNYGGTLVLIDEEERRDFGRMVAKLHEQRVEHLHVTCGALQALAEAWAAHGKPLLELRRVWVAGDQLRVTPEIVALFEAMPACALYNRLGLAETHSVATGQVEGAPSTWPKIPGIGRPLPGSRLYVLDDAMQPLPAGAVGELYAGGDNEGRGYWRQPAITAERFLPDPFGVPGARLFRTGDLARVRDDGTFELLGRRDHQIKVRGHRVEFGDVEAALLRLARVRAAVVTAVGDAEKRLVAYVVEDRRDGQRRTGREVREELRDLLPEYMIPARVVFLDALPRTPGNKVDRRALPIPDEKDDDEGASYTAPRDAGEIRLAEIWRELLRVPRVGVHDNFFELGGDSLTATRLASRLAGEIGRTLPLRTIFDHPTVEELAREAFGTKTHHR